MSRLEPDHWTALAQARAEALGSATDGALDVLRRQGAAALRALELPHRRTEFWKYSRVGALLTEGLLDQPPADAPAVDAPSVAGLDAIRVVLVDGRLLSIDPLPAGVRIERISESPEPGAPLELSGPESTFRALNAALLEEGIRIHVAADVRLDQAIELVLAQNGEGIACGVQVRVEVVLDSGAEAHIVERQAGNAAIFQNAVIDLRLAEHARLAHTRIALDGGEGRWLSAIDARCAGHARYELHQAMVGAAFRRSEIRIHLDAPGAETQVHGASVGGGKDHLDTQMCIEHAAPHCVSNQTFRAIGGGASQTILGGRIHIHRDAQKTAADFNTRNLLLTHDAEIDAKPELEIYADDVTCSHGATVGQLDPMSIFYLRSRGIDEARARTLLGFAHLASVVESIPNDALAAHARAGLEAAFERAAGGAET